MKLLIGKIRQVMILDGHYLNRKYALFRNPYTSCKPTLLEGGRVLPGEAGCREIEIRGDIVLFKSGHILVRDNILGNLFKDIKGYKRNADWIIFAENLVLICEMKTVSQRDFKAQLESSMSFVNFLLDKIWIHSNINTKKPSIRHILFSKRGDKQNLKDELKAENYGDGILLYHLACDSIYSITQFK